MRQVGILAAAGLYAIENNRSKLSKDHEHAQLIAKAISECPHFDCNLENVQSNIIMFDVKNGTAVEWVEKLSDLGILVVPFGPSTIRVTLHLDVSSKDVDQVIRKIEAL